MHGVAKAAALAGDRETAGHYYQRSGKKLSILKVPTFEFGE
jgi:hypothetical protein